MLTKQTYLSSVKLSGYKSIKDASINLVEGLNILIGKNAAGKSNFVSFLNNIINSNYEKLAQFESRLDFGNSEIIKFVEISKSFKIDPKTDRIQNDVIIKTNDDENKFLKDLVASEELFHSILINPEINQTIPLLNELVSFKIYDTNGIDSTLFEIVNDENTPYFIKELSLNFFIDIFEYESKNDAISVEIESLRKFVDEKFRKLKIVGKYLKNYSPISDLRLAPNYNISRNNNAIYISNLILEFEINGIWYNYNDLSDGSKRLFHIISDVITIKEDDGIFIVALIEEPELGIHPHQYFKLLQFLKQESRNFQIIITTHSPQSLNILENDELDRIVLVENKDNKTLLRHFSKEEKEKAIEYKKNMYLSDYWLYSDLEN